MTERDEIYRQILHIGLNELRDAAVNGRIQYCAVEAEHLHNIPSLIGEPNELRHDYYFDAERAYYLERVERSEEIEFMLGRYAELWQQLEELRTRK